MSDEGYVVRIRGLPWSCSVDEVQRFFSGMYTGKKGSCILLSIECNCSVILFLLKGLLYKFLQLYIEKKCSHNI